MRALRRPGCTCGFSSDSLLLLLEAAQLTSIPRTDNRTPKFGRRTVYFRPPRVRTGHATDRMKTSTLDTLLGPQGSIARRLGERYEHRPQQLEMAAAVERAFTEGH